MLQEDWVRSNYILTSNWSRKLYEGSVCQFFCNSKNLNFPLKYQSNIKTNHYWNSGLLFVTENSLYVYSFFFTFTPCSECFTYVTKTIVDLTTYSRKPGDYNGNIFFEIDIMKNSSPLNLKLTFFATVKTKITLLFYWTHSTLSSASE